MISILLSTFLHLISYVSTFFHIIFIPSDLSTFCFVFEVIYYSKICYITPGAEFLAMLVIQNSVDMYQMGFLLPVPERAGETQGKSNESSFPSMHLFFKLE